MVNERGPPIMGRDWITVFKVFLKELGLSTLSIQSMVYRFPSVFSNFWDVIKIRLLSLYLNVIQN